MSNTANETTRQGRLSKIARKGFTTRLDGSPLTGVDITHLACFRPAKKVNEKARLAALRARGIKV